MGKAVLVLRMLGMGCPGGLKEKELLKIIRMLLHREDKCGRL